MQRAAGVKTVRMRGDAAHRMHRHRPADHFGVFAPVRIRPALRQADFLPERDVGDFGGDAADRVCAHAAFGSDRVRSVLRAKKSFGHQLERGNGVAPVGQGEFADDQRRDANSIRALDLEALPFKGRAGVRGDSESACRAQRVAVRIAREQAVIRRARIAHDQMMRICILDQIIEIDPVVVQQFVDQRADKQAIGAGPDADPFVGDRAIAGAHRIDRDDLGAAALDLAEAELDRIGIVVLGDAEHQQGIWCDPNPARRIPRTEPPIVYMPAAAMLTEQKPPCAA